MFLRQAMLAVAVSMAAASPAFAQEPQMWAPRPDVAACQRVRAPEDVARLFGIEPFDEEHVTRIRMADGEVIWTFFVPGASLPRHARRAAQIAWPRGFLVFEARLTEEDCLKSAQGLFSDMGVPRRLMRRQSSIP